MVDNMNNYTIDYESITIEAETEQEARQKAKEIKPEIDQVLEQ